MADLSVLGSEATMSTGVDAGREPLPVCLWKENPNRLVTLWDIVQAFPLSSLLFVIDSLKMLEWSCNRVRKKEHGGVPALQKDLKWARHTLSMALKFCDE